MDIAIKYERINLGYEKCIFKPICVIKGKYDEDTGIFETEYGDVCMPMESGMQYYEDGFFGCLTTIEELSQKYNGLEEDEILMEYYVENSSYYNLGYFNSEENKTDLIILSSDEVENALNSVMTSGVDDESNIEITFSLDEIIELRNIDNIKDIHAKLDVLIEFINSVKDGSDELTTNNGINEHKDKFENKEKKGLALQKEKSKGITLKELRKEVKDVIKGQDKAVDAVTRAIIVNQNSLNPKHKSHILITGPSGTGKTEMINIISKRLGIPYFKADATAYTKEGYVGKSVYSMLNGLITAADGNLEAAENGILIIDEIDKKLSSRSDDVSGIDVLNSMLKMMDRDIIEVDRGRGWDERSVMFDTSNLTIIFMGAFADLYSSKEKEKKKSIGFGEPQESQEKQKIVITNEDLIKAGMPPEFLGRIPVITSTEELELEDLVEILHKSKGGAIEEEKEFFNDLGITIKFTNEYIKEIAKKAHQSKTGARNLRKLVRESLSDAYDEVLSGRKIKVLKLTKKTAHDSKNYYTE